MKRFNGIFIDFNSPYHLCTNEKEFKKLLKDKKIDPLDEDGKHYEFVPDHAIGITYDFSPLGGPIVMNIDLKIKHTKEEITIFIAHEAMHVWQHIRAGLMHTITPEDTGYWEFEAYCYEDIFNNLLTSYMDQRYKKNALK